MDTRGTPTESGVDLSRIGAMVTPEQELSASAARKRRTITRKRSTSGGAPRSKTPMRRSSYSSYSEDDDADADERRRRGDDGDRREEQNVTETRPTEDTMKEKTLKSESELVAESDTKTSEEVARKPIMLDEATTNRYETKDVPTKHETEDVRRTQETEDMTRKHETDEVTMEPGKNRVEIEEVIIKYEPVKRRLEADELMGKDETTKTQQKTDEEVITPAKKQLETNQREIDEESTAKAILQETVKSKRETGEIATKSVEDATLDKELRSKSKPSVEQNSELLQRRTRPKPKPTTDHDSSGQSQDEPVRRLRPRASKYHQDEVLRRVKAKSLPRDDIPTDEPRTESVEDRKKREWERVKRELTQGNSRETTERRHEDSDGTKRREEYVDGVRRRVRKETGEESTDGTRRRVTNETGDSTDGIRRRAAKTGDDSTECVRRRVVKEAHDSTGESTEGTRRRVVKEADDSTEGTRRRAVKEADVSREGVRRREEVGEIRRRAPNEATSRDGTKERSKRDSGHEIDGSKEGRKRDSGHEIDRERDARKRDSGHKSDGSKRDSGHSLPASNEGSKRDSGHSVEDGTTKRDSAAENVSVANGKKTRESSVEDAKKRETKTSTVSDSSSVNADRRGSLPKNFEEKIQKLDKMMSDNKKEILSMLHRAKATVEEKGKELRRRRFHRTDQKRSQSTPKQLSEAEVMESFKRAQVATAEREKERIRLLSARRYSSGSEKSRSPEPRRPARKPGNKSAPATVEEPKQAEKKPMKKHKIKSNKIIEILDPKTSKVIATKEMGHVAKMRFTDVFRVIRQFGPRQIFREYAKYKRDMHEEYAQIRNQRKRCFNHLLILMIFCGLGGIVFKFTEGSFENFYKCGVKRVKRDFIDLLWIRSHNMREEEWKSMARNKLRVFEDELHTAHEAGIHSYSGQKSWSFLNGIVYCLTVVTTIGYGHLYPTTKTGQALTIVYSLIGIPLFLIILTDFGKLFTRCIKFLWSFVRRLYYTGSCRSMRKTHQVQEIFKGAQMVYELATFRRPSMFDPNMNKNASPGDNSDQNTTAPPTPAISNYEIDDEFNLPISVAILLLVLYILLGALLFGIWEGWDFFASFYFVFISMSTIGFGDYVPRHPIFMIVSIVYLVFGLALMSMCINVVQTKLSDTFNQASAKIGATIGLGVAPEDGTIKPLPPKSVEMPQVHGSINDVNSIRSGELHGPNTSRV